MAGPRDVRLRKEELFHALGYKPHSGQWNVHRSNASRRVVACGARWGKSTVGIHEAIAELLTPRDEGRGWLVAPTYDLTMRIFRTVVHVMTSRFPHRVLEFESREHRIVISNLGGGTTELRAKSADRPASLLGESLDFLVVDEGAQLKPRVWDQHLGPRLVDRKGTALILSTPNGGGWFHSMFRRGQNGRDPGFVSWSMPTWTNPHIPSEAIDAERSRLPEDAFREQYGAEFVGVPSEPCAVCKGPDPAAQYVHVLDAGEKERRCPECHELVGEDGLTWVRLFEDGEGRCVIIRCDVAPDDVAMPA